MATSGGEGRDSSSRGDYFRDKIQKLQNIQEDTSIITEDIISNIFQGCYVYVNGVTFPPIHELRRLLRCHGAICEGYQVSRITHIVCNFLTEAQIKQYNSKTHSIGDRSKTLHVTVKWVLESIRLRKRQPEILFQTEGISAEKDGQHLTRFFGQQKKESESLLVPEKHKDALNDNEDDYVPPVAVTIQPSTDVDKNITNDNTSIVHNHQQATHSTIIDSTTLTSEHPDFLRQYFSRSRLSFIGRWRNRVPLIANKFNPHLKNMHAAISGRGSTVTNHLFNRSSSTANMTTYSSNTSSSSSSSINQNNNGDIGITLRSPNTKQDSRDERVVIHIDMDCFFVSALTRNRPDLINIPVAVAHSASAGSSEISSCNYPARRKGVCSGMFMSKARVLCPELVVLPYDFDLYTELSEQLYSVLYSSSALMVEPVSVDEAYLEFAPHTDGLRIASQLRTQIFEATKGCTASAGIGSNMLLARLATKKAKPNGQYLLRCPSSGLDIESVRRKLSISDENLEDDNDGAIDNEAHSSHNISNKLDQVNRDSNSSNISDRSSDEQLITLLSTLPVADIPGIGYHMVAKLDEKKIKYCRNIWSINKSRLEEWFGISMGTLLWEASRGIDTRALQPVETPKSIGAEVNWALRFSYKKKSEDFLLQLMDEISSRLISAEKKGRTVTVKLKVKRPGSGDPKKFLGHGICDNVSKSCTVNRSVHTGKDLYAIALPLYRELLHSMPVADLRGMGATVSKLEDLNVHSVVTRSPTQPIQAYTTSAQSNIVNTTATDIATIPVSNTVANTIASTGVVDLSATQDDPPVTKTNRIKEGHPTATDTLLDDFLQSVPRELHAEVMAQMKGATENAPNNSTTFVPFSSSTTTHKQTTTTATATTTSRPIINPNPIGTVSKQVNKATNKKRKIDSHQSAKPISTDANQLVLDLVFDPDVENSNSNSRSMSRWALKPAKATLSPNSNINYSSNTLKPGLLNSNNHNQYQQNQRALWQADDIVQVQGKDDIWCIESLVNVGAGIQSWFNQLSGLCTLPSKTFYITSSTAISKDIHGFYPGFIDTADVTYLCQYTEWLSSRQQYDIAESYVNMVVCTIQKIIIQFTEIYEKLQVEKSLLIDSAVDGEVDKNSYSQARVGQYSQIHTQTQSQTHTQIQIQSQQSLFAQVRASANSNSQNYSSAAPTQYQRHILLPHSTVENNDEKQSVDEDDTRPQVDTNNETSIIDSLTKSIDSWKAALSTVKSHFQDVLVNARNRMFI